MSVAMLSRFGVVLFFIALVSGCVSTSTSPRWTGSNECRWDPESCMYEGSYEPGEREFAEQEAKKLNQEAARKLRRRSSWWW